MERLTKRGEKGFAYFPKCFQEPCGGIGCKIDGYEFMMQVCDRLAAYEDTGLEPEDYKRIFYEDAILKLASQCLGLTPARLRELAQAERDGRLVVLPCNVGDTVYYAVNGEIKETEIDAIHKWSSL